MREFTRAGAAEGDAGGDAFDVGAVVQQAAQLFARVVVGKQGGDGVMAGADGGVATQGAVDPAFEVAAARRSLAVVDAAGEAAFVVAAQGVVDFEVAAAGGVDGEAVVAAFAQERGERRQGLFVGVVEVLQEAACGAEGGIVVGVTGGACLAARGLAGGGALVSFSLMMLSFLVVFQAGWRCLYGFAKAHDSLVPKPVQRRLETQAHGEAGDSGTG